MTSRVTDSIWFNAVWFQSIWFCTVLGRETLLPIALALLVLHVVLARDPLVELRQLVLVGGIGMSADAVLSLTGVFQFAGGVLVPLWLCCLWLAFAAALGRSLAWLANRPLLAVVAGAVAFPLNYWAGQRLGAVDFGYTLALTLTVLAATWSLLLPLMFRMMSRLAPMHDQEA
jgi:hypothetical protein